MKVAAVIAEYNPLHEGHLYHLGETKRLLGEDMRLVAVMSGHTVQRGAFPLLSKFARTEAALSAGFDLVFELDSPHACAPAERFARSAVDIAARLDIVTHLSFGAEQADLDILRELARRKPDSYPKDESLARALPAMYPDAARLFTPNNILALEYLRALDDLAPDIEPLAVERKGSRHDDHVASASAWRKRLRAGHAPELPFREIYEREHAQGRAPSALARVETAILSKLRGLSAEVLSHLPDAGGGLWERLQGAIRQAESLEALFVLAKTKRYPLSRLRRTVLCAYLDITGEMALAKPPLRLLGIGAHGTELLKRIPVPILSRAAAHKDILAAESAVTDQFALTLPKPPPMGWEWTAGTATLRTRIP